MKNTVPSKNLIRFVLSSAVALLIVTLQSATLGPGETLDWDANTPAKSEIIEATGGTIVFNSSVNVPNATVTISTSNTKPAVGDYTLIKGKTLTGLTNLTLVHNVSGTRILQLVRNETSLVLRVIPAITTIIIR